jgi:hypothetical protein
MQDNWKQHQIQFKPNTLHAIMLTCSNYSNLTINQQQTTMQPKNSTIQRQNYKFEEIKKFRVMNLQDKHNE